MHEQRLGGVADAGSLRLGVEDDVEGAVEVGGGVDVDVAVAVAVDDVGDLGVVEDRSHQRGPAPGDQAVDVAGELHQLDGGLVRDILHEDDGVVREARLGRPLPQQSGHRLVRSQRRRRAPQQGGVARLEAQAAGVAGHVGPVLVDDRHHAEGHPDAGDLEAVGPPPPVEDLAHGVGQGGDVAEPPGHPGEAGLGEAEPVEGAGFHPPGGGRLDVDGVGLEDVAGALLEQVGGGQERLVLGRRGGGGQHPGGGLGPPSELCDLRVRRTIHTATLPAGGSPLSGRNRRSSAAISGERNAGCRLCAG